MQVELGVEGVLEILGILGWRGGLRGFWVVNARMGERGGGGERGIRADGEEGVGLDRRGYLRF